MSSPPFKRIMSPMECCENDVPVQDEVFQRAASAMGRSRLADLDPHLHCSVIGTCLSAAALRKLMARHCETQGATDLVIHHTAVELVTQGHEVAKVLHKALDRRHASTVRTFARAHDAGSLGRAWSEAVNQGEIAGAYWALLTHRHVTPELRQLAFGEVHMLSHLVGSANGANIRRLVALEKDNAELNERLDRELGRRQDLVDERQELALQVRHLKAQEIQLQELRRQLAAQSAADPNDVSGQALVALHTERREKAEQAAAFAAEDVTRLQQELERARQHASAIGQELAAAETQLRELIEPAAGDAAAPNTRALGTRLKDRCILYVGGRPSSRPAIRDLVVRHGGEFLHHDGGLEVRKGLLASAIPRADLVVFPVDCVDHDSALNLKRLSERHGKPYLALRSASIASFAAALSAEADRVRPAGGVAPTQCLRHA